MTPASAWTRFEPTPPCPEPGRWRRTGIRRQTPLPAERGCELRRVAEHHEPRLVRHRGEYLRHEREIDHRPLVEDERVNRKAAPVDLSASEEPPVHGCRLDFEAFERGGYRHELAMAAAHRFLEAGGRLAGRRSEHDSIGSGERELDEQGHDCGRDRGLARTRTARDHADSAARGGSGGSAYRIVRRGAGKEPIERRIESRRLGSGDPGEPPQPGRDRLLRCPQPLKIEPAPIIEDQRPLLRIGGDGHDGAGLERFDPAVQCGKPHPRPRHRPPLMRGSAIQAWPSRVQALASAAAS